jgi:hypothetical protein
VLWRVSVIEPSSTHREWIPRVTGKSHFYSRMSKGPKKQRRMTTRAQSTNDDGGWKQTAAAAVAARGLGPYLRAKLKAVWLSPGPHSAPLHSSLIRACKGFYPPNLILPATVFTGDDKIQGVTTEACAVKITACLISGVHELRPSIPSAMHQTIWSKVLNVLSLTHLLR